MGSLEAVILFFPAKLYIALENMNFPFFLWLVWSTQYVVPYLFTKLSIYFLSLISNLSVCMPLCLEHLKTFFIPVFGTQEHLSISKNTIIFFSLLCCYGVWLDIHWWHCVPSGSWVLDLLIIIQFQEWLSGAFSFTHLINRLSLCVFVWWSRQFLTVNSL